MSGKGWDVTCDGGEGTEILLATLRAVPEEYVLRIEWDDEDGEERVGDFTMIAAGTSDVLLAPYSDRDDTADPELRLLAGAIRSVTIY